MSGPGHGSTGRGKDKRDNVSVDADLPSHIMLTKNRCFCRHLKMFHLKNKTSLFEGVFINPFMHEKLSTVVVNVVPERVKT